MIGDIDSVRALLAVLRQPGPRRDLYETDSGGRVSFDLVPVSGEVVRAALASGAIVESYPGKHAPYWRTPEMVEDQHLVSSRRSAGERHLP
jgi:hypothetical protein